MNKTRPFAGFETMLALRYLRARRKEGFISVIAGFSFLGIMLGVATLIIVMSVMPSRIMNININSHATAMLIATHGES